ncbi:MAG: hypothetical protein J6C80_01245 [Flavobacteriales bacterium]|nr:hypothetical protein [Flavobacteriales bacterium]
MTVMYKQRQDRRRGVAVTVIVHAVMVLLLFICGVKYLDPPPLSGVIVAFGADVEAVGRPVVDYREQVEVATPKTIAREIEISEQQLITQEEESPLEVKKAEKKPVEKPVKTTPKPVKKTEKKAAETPKTAPEVEKVVEKPRPSQSTTSALANIFSGGTDASKGDSNGSGVKGAKDGSISSDRYGVSGGGGDGNYHLSGRRAVTRPKPEYTGRDQGVVRVKIRVDRQGNVIYAKCSLQGTEVTDPVLLRNAERAALQTKWTANPTGEVEQEGYIIYNFRIGG